MVCLTMAAGARCILEDDATGGFDEMMGLLNVDSIVKEPGVTGARRKQDTGTALRGK